MDLDRRSLEKDFVLLVDFSRADLSTADLLLDLSKAERFPDFSRTSRYNDRFDLKSTCHLSKPNIKYYILKVKAMTNCNALYTIVSSSVNLNPLFRIVARKVESCTEV